MGDINMKVIYSNCLGSYVFDKKIEDSVLFKKGTEVEKCIQLEKEELIEEEKQLLKKHPDALFINKKSEKNIKQLEDSNKIREILLNFRDYGSKYFETEILLARNKIKNSVKFDNLVVHSINLIEEVNKTINLFSRRLREWYELYNPEFSRKIADNIDFAKKITEKSKKELLKEIKFDEKISMGADLEDFDIKQILELAKEIIQLSELKQKNEKYLEKVMGEKCPNIQKVAGTLIGAKLIALAGSFQRIMELPASTVQLLGAEKAFFRHMKTGAKIPKHGIILQHP
ncbi:hypothetical protein KY308_02370, partial [Candidatus Woesearchaeota archaeon]|nr:hypothetical protein [Candidatus Woesearchaeota archaeon]